MIYHPDGSPCNNGADMWRDYAVRYGNVGARVICRRYLKLQENTPETSEREFCRELRAAMESAPNLTGIAAYPYPHDEHSVNSDLVCANTIGDALRACELGDGTYLHGEALDALIEHFGFKRVCFVLARETCRDSGCPEPLSAWASAMNIRGDVPKPDVRLRPDALAGLALELLSRQDLLAAHGIPPGRSDRPSLLGKLHSNKERAGHEKGADKGRAAPKKRGGLEVT